MGAARPGGPVQIPDPTASFKFATSSGDLAAHAAAEARSAVAALLVGFSESPKSCAVLGELERLTGNDSPGRSAEILTTKEMAVMRSETEWARQVGHGAARG